MTGASRLVVCAGMTHGKHNVETYEELPIPAIFRTRPAFFIKAPCAIIDDGEPIVLPDPSPWLNQDDFEGPYGQVTGEVELAVVFAEECWRVTAEEVMTKVAGFTVFNDVSHRDLQRAGHAPSLAKGFATFGPLGSKVVPWANVPGVRSARFSLRVNGEERQGGTMDELLYPIEQLLSLASQAFRFRAGDVLTTGSPAGMFEYGLAPGDVIEAEIEGVGTLRNPVVGL